MSDPTTVILEGPELIKQLRTLSLLEIARIRQGKILEQLSWKGERVDTRKRWWSELAYWENEIARESVLTNE